MSKMTDLPLLGDVQLAQTLEGYLTTGTAGENPWLPEGHKGQFLSKDNWGDGTIIEARGRYHMTMRTGYPLEGSQINGCQYQSKVHDGDPVNGWGLCTGPGPEAGLIKPYKSIQENHAASNGVNIDTSCLMYLPNEEKFVSLQSSNPGDVDEGAGEGGRVWTIQIWRYDGDPDAIVRTKDDWNGSATAGHHLVNGRDNTAATWAQPWGIASELDGGCKECSGFYDPELGTCVIFWEGDYAGGAAWNGGSTRHFAIGRGTVSEADLASVLTDATVTWTPTPAADSYIWRPQENGMKDDEVNGETNETAVWGTSERVTPRAHVSRDPSSGYYHMLLQQKKPNTGGGVENRTAGIGHYWSDNYGIKGSWHADVRNPIINWDSLGFDEPTQANKLNSPHILWDPNYNKAWVCFWGNNTDGGINSPDTQLYMMPFSTSGSDPKRRRRGRLYRKYRPDVIPLTYEEQKETGIIGIRPPHRRR